MSSSSNIEREGSVPDVNATQLNTEPEHNTSPAAKSNEREQVVVEKSSPVERSNEFGTLFSSPFSSTSSLRQQNSTLAHPRTTQTRGNKKSQEEKGTPIFAENENFGSAHQENKHSSENPLPLDRWGEEGKERGEALTKGEAKADPEEEEEGNYSHSSSSSSSTLSPQRNKSAKELFVMRVQQVIVVNLIARAPLGEIDIELINERKKRKMEERQDGRDDSSSTLSSPRSFELSPRNHNHNSSTKSSREKGPVCIVSGSAANLHHEATKSNSALITNSSSNGPSAKKVLLPPIQVSRATATTSSRKEDSSETTGQSFLSSPPPSPSSKNYPTLAPSQLSSSSPPRITNAQKQWRAALNQRPTTCERNLRDLENVRAVVAAERRAQSDLVDTEVAVRRRIEAAEQDLRSAFNNKHAKRMQYLQRLQLSEKVKKATVDKQNEKIHTLFERAQEDDRLRREREKVAAMEERLAKAAESKRLSEEAKLKIEERQLEEQKEKSNVILEEKLARKEARRNARLGLFMSRRENVRNALVEKYVRTQGRAASESQKLRKNKEQINAARATRLPVHAFLRPATIQEDDYEKEVQNASTGSQKSISEKCCRRYNGVGTEDSYQHMYSNSSHTNNTSASESRSSGRRDLSKNGSRYLMPMTAPSEGKGNKKQGTPFSSARGGGGFPLLVSSVVPREHRSIYDAIDQFNKGEHLLSTQTQQNNSSRATGNSSFLPPLGGNVTRGGGGEGNFQYGFMGTQTDDNWMDTLPDDSDNSYDDHQ